MHKYNQAKDDHVNVVLVSMKWQQFKFYILTKLKKHSEFSVKITIRYDTVIIF